jgi:hypothetical protein
MVRACILAAALVLFPSFASAAITVRPTNQAAGPGFLIPIDFFADPATLSAGRNERLNAFTMTVEAIGFGLVGGNRPWFVVPQPDPAGYFRFDRPSDPTHEYVFGSTPSASPYDPTGQSTYNILYIAAVLDPPRPGVDITEVRNGFARVYVFWPASGAPGAYTVRVGNDFLSLGGEAGTIEAVGGSGFFAVIPEPTAPGIAAAALLWLLRRRRPA